MIPDRQSHEKIDLACGFTLIEVLVAIAIVALALATASSSLITNMKANKTGARVFEGAQAAQTVIDELRYTDVSALPESGTDEVRHVQIDALKTYDVYVTYCNDPTHCTSEDVRQISLRVELDGKKIYETETVFTQLEKGYGSSNSSSSTGSSSSSSSSSTGSTSTSSSSTGSSTSSSSTGSSTSSTSTGSSSTSSSSTGSSTSSTSTSSTSSSTSSTSTSSTSGSSSSSSGGKKKKKCKTWGC